MSTWMIEPYALGMDDGLHEPGSRQNPAARPLRVFKNGEILAVNVSVEAADWMERQGLMGRIKDDPRAFYTYYNMLAFALTYNPAVIRPIGGLTIMPDSSVLHPGFRDPLAGPRALDDGWSASIQPGGFAIFPDEGWVQVMLFYPNFTLDLGKGGSLKCVHCGQEGFVDDAGMPQGPDPEPEAALGLVYFQVVGLPGNGTALRLAPRPQTAIELRDTNGTIKNQADDTDPGVWLEVNKQLPPTFQLPGEHQVRDAYICVE
jgi:hypothetical protein